MSAIVCSFSGGIGNMRPGDQKGPTKVLRALAADPSFSVWDATERASIGQSLTWLRERGLIEYPEPQPAFPWCKVRITEAGKQAIEDAERGKG